MPTSPASATTAKVALQVTAIVDDVELLFQHAETQPQVMTGLTLTHGDVGAAVAAAVLTHDTAAFSYESIRWSYSGAGAAQAQPDAQGAPEHVLRVHLDIVIDVPDTDAFTAAAAEATANVWPGDDELLAQVKASLPVAAYELLIASNEQPSPDEMGVQIDSNAEDCRTL